MDFKKKWYWLGFFLIATLGFWLRIKSLDKLIDTTTGKYVPILVDPYIFMRYSEFILENGALMSIDYMRYFPSGFSNLGDFNFLANVIVFFFKLTPLEFDKFFVLFPVFCFLIGLLFFFLLVKKLFSPQVSLLTTLILAIIPGFLDRTRSGFTDKESLAIVLFFMALYFFYIGWKEKGVKAYGFSSLAGIATGLMALTWGGVQFLIVGIALFALISLIFVEFKKENLLKYSIWMFLYLFIFKIFRGASFLQMINDFDFVILLFTLISGLIYYLIANKNRFNIPDSLFVLIISSILCAISLTIFGGMGVLFEIFKELIVILSNPFGQSVWAKTITESYQPYFTFWRELIGWKFIIVFLIGALYLFNAIAKQYLKKKDLRIVNLAFGFLLFGFIFTRFSANSILDGENFISKFLFFSSIVLFLIVLFYFYIKNHKKSLETRNIHIEAYIFILVLFFVTLVGAKGAIRFAFIFVPFAAILFSLTIFRIYGFILSNKGGNRFGLIFLLVLILISPINIAGGFLFGALDKGVLVDHFQKSSSFMENTVPIFNPQWQNAAKWIRENTEIPELDIVNVGNGIELRYRGPVFAQWWDYGYLIQSKGERATVTDGGNAKGNLNYRMGRYFLTAEDEIESLKFLKSRNVTHALITGEELAKYITFSAIGSNENADRLSRIDVLKNDRDHVRIEGENIIYDFRGRISLNEDLEYNSNLFPKDSSLITSVFVRIVNVEKGSKFNRPAIRVQSIDGIRSEIVPLNCLVINGKELNFDGDGYDGCFLITKLLSLEGVKDFEVGFFISERVKKSLFYKLYLIGEESEYFKLVYEDSDLAPLSLFNSRAIGPIKIWEINYPEDLEVPEIYYED